MTKRETKSRPILAVHILFAALMLSMYLPGNAKVKASPVCMTVACVLIELAVIYQLIRRKKARTAGDIGAIVFLFCFSGRCIQRALAADIILVPTPEAVFSVFYTMRERMILAYSPRSRCFLSASACRCRSAWLSDWSPVGTLVCAIPSCRSHACCRQYRPSSMRRILSRSCRRSARLPPWFDHRYFLADVSADGSARRRAGSAHSRQRQSIGAETAKLLWEVLLPWVMPGILTGLRGSLSSAFMLLTLAEMMGAHSGLGYFIRNFADYANYTNVLAGILLVALVITLLNRAVTALETRLGRWH